MAKITGASGRFIFHRLLLAVKVITMPSTLNRAQIYKKKKHVNNRRQSCMWSTSPISDSERSLISTDMTVQHKRNAMEIHQVDSKSFNADLDLYDKI